MSKEFEKLVNQAIKEATVGEDGKVTYKEGTDSNVIYAATLEKRRRDTQTSLAKEQQRADRLESENTKIAETWEKEVSANLTKVQQLELDELKVSDPEAWREKLNTYEASNKNAVKDKRKKISEDAHKETELQRRTRLLEEHNEANPKSALTDEVIENDLPPRITKKLEKGEITFDEFISEASTFLGKEKVIDKGTELEDEDVDLSDLGGNDKPTDEAIDNDASDSYADEVY